MKLSQSNDMTTIKYKIIHDMRNFNFDNKMILKILDMNKCDIIDILLVSIDMTNYLKNIIT
jgi:hypothetical protein